MKRTNKAIAETAAEIKAETTNKKKCPQYPVGGEELIFPLSPLFVFTTA